MSLGRYSTHLPAVSGMVKAVLERSRLVLTLRVDTFYGPSLPRLNGPGFQNITVLREFRYIRLS